MINTILFDLDGTIMDTNELIISTFLHILNHPDADPLTREHIIPHMGGTLDDQLRTFSGLTDVSGLVKDYRAYNQIHHDQMVKPFPYVIEVIQELRARGIKLGVVTTKIRPSTIRVLNLFNLTSSMDYIVTVDDVEHPKPHAEPVLKALAGLNAEAEHTLMVGDSSFDILSAQAAGVKSAGVAWSLKGEETLRGYGPDYMLYDMRDLLKLELQGVNVS
ncbi:pyrophosphatase PpaX [Paenibacillus sp. SEL1]|uniref:pyrophosphatase PpaX n=1 Tax=Paenibacillus TaxID=44249 RepID=UPI00202596B2|nr:MULTISPECIES: pyrophosphatase PpaX [Paenibacillus]MCP3810438.1 pyrophosphatase PpaX [Paenibacillus sp. Lou8.1]MDY8048205.1 pyrophosphatase PpaX [Paenibacillus polymyxa]URJ39799.1 pyrophosphatase PpaX [Paenibacillus polymyxa]